MIEEGSILKKYISLRNATVIIIVIAFLLAFIVAWVKQEGSIGSTIGISVLCSLFMSYYLIKYYDTIHGVSHVRKLWYVLSLFLPGIVWLFAIITLISHRKTIYSQNAEEK